MAPTASRLRQILAAPPALVTSEPCYRPALTVDEADSLVDYLSACEARTSRVDAAEADRLSGLVDRWVRYYLQLSGVTTR